MKRQDARDAKGRGVSDFFTEGNEGNGGASRCVIHGSFNDLKGLANGRLGNTSHWHPLRAPVQKSSREEFLQEETEGTKELRAASSTVHSMI
jgi:hypothetical protein